MRKIAFTLFLLMALLVTACGALGAGVAVEPVLQQPAETAAVAEAAVADVPADAVANQTNQPAPDPLSIDSAVLAQEQAFINVFDRVSPAVVHIIVNMGEGSGFVVDESGYIVTNNHVVSGAQQMTVLFSDGTQREATLVGTDPDSDLAVIKVDAAPGELTAVSLGDSDALKVGQMVVAIGSPFGLENTLTTGVVSGLNRFFPGGQAPDGSSYTIPDVIQTDAAINPGNSGGPLLNLHGEVIGVNTAIESPVRGSSGVGFAVPVNVVKAVVPQLIESGRATHPWLGISGTTLTAELAQSAGLDATQRGVLVATVTPGGPAAQAGLRGGDQQTGAGGDVIIAVDGRPVREFDDLLGYVIQQTSVGQTITLDVLRGGQSLTIQLTLGERPSAN